MPLKPRTIVNTISALVSYQKPSLGQKVAPFQSNICTQYLLLLTTLAAYALHRNDYLSLPIPNILGALCIALPPLAGVALETTISLLATANRPSSSTTKPLTLTTTSNTTNNNNNNRSRLSPSRAAQIQHAVVAILLIYETVSTLR